MIGQREALRMFGCGVLDPRRHRIGIVGQLFLDDQTDQPAWITVQTGLFGTNESFVPLIDAEFDDVTVTVPIPKRVVRVAPRVSLVNGDLPPEQAQALYRYYGVHQGLYRAPIEDLIEQDRSEATPEQRRHWVTAG